MSFTKLTDTQIDQFHTLGYVAEPGFWTPTEIVALQVEVDRLQNEGKLRNVATDGDGKTVSASKANLQLCPMLPHSELFRALPFCGKVIEAMRSLIGDPVVLHLDQVFLKPACNGAATNWHQDNAYFKIPNPMLGTAMWTAVHDANLANGTIRVIPPSYRELLEHSRDPNSDHHIRCYPDESQAVTVELPAGGVVFFAYGVAHATGPNTTAHDRAGAAYHFLNGDAIPGDYFKQTWQGGAERPILSGANSIAGKCEFGYEMKALWEREVAALNRKEG